jgi:hypothetical protein
MKEFVDSEFFLSNPFNRRAKRFESATGTRAAHRHCAVIIITVAPFYAQKMVIGWVDRYYSKSIFDIGFCEKTTWTCSFYKSNCIVNICIQNRCFNVRYAIVNRCFLRKRQMMNYAIFSEPSPEAKHENVPMVA